MKQLYIIANWKENAVKPTEWFDEVQSEKFKVQSSEEKTTIVCPPFSLLQEVKHYIDEKQLPIKLGSQDISQFAKGAHTGEVSGETLQELVQYVIIGHSERREMGETNEIVNEKTERAIENNLIPIICVSNKEQTHSLRLQDKTIQQLIAFEPLEAIGTGQPEDPQSANNVAKKIKNTLGNVLVLYGGSVNAENVNEFTKQEHINGVLVGGASLDAKSFSGIIQKA